MKDIDSDWLDSLTPERHADAVRELIRLIDTETCYRVNLWCVLRALPPEELLMMLTIFDRMRSERKAA